MSKKNLFQYTGHSSFHRMFKFLSLYTCVPVISDLSSLNTYWHLKKQL